MRKETDRQTEKQTNIQSEFIIKQSQKNKHTKEGHKVCNIAQFQFFIIKGDGITSTFFTSPSKLNDIKENKKNSLLVNL